MDLKKLHEDLIRNKAEASIDLTATDPRLRAGAQGRQRQAVIEASRLEQVYKNEVVKNVVIIGVKGTGAEKFAEIAQEKYKTISVNYFKILNDIVENISVKRQGGKNYTTHVYHMVLDELNRAKLTYGISSIPVLQPRFDVLGNSQPLRESLYKNFAHHYGSDLYSIATRYEIAQLALKKGFTGTKLPVVVYNYDEETGINKGILTEPVAIVNVTDEEVTEKLVKENLTQVRDLIKKTK